MIQSINMNDHIIQDKGAKNLYIYHFILLISHEESRLFLKNLHGYKCDIDFIKQFNK